MIPEHASDRFARIMGAFLFIEKCISPTGSFSLSLIECVFLY
jgi:hypothetical protein